MLYAATRNSLVKSLGATLFTDSIFATSKSELTPDAYASHRRHLAAPKPLSAREQELADVRAAEGSENYEGSRARVNHIGSGVGMRWSEDVENAVKHLGASDGCEIVVIVRISLRFLRTRLMLLLVMLACRHSNRDAHAPIFL